MPIYWVRVRSLFQDYAVKAPDEDSAIKRACEFHMDVAEQASYEYEADAMLAKEPTKPLLCISKKRAAALFSTMWVPYQGGAEELKEKMSIRAFRRR